MKFASVIIFIVCALASFVIFDLVVRTQFENYRDSWNKDGKPHGFLFRPAGSSWISMQAQYLLLIFRNPEWMVNDLKLKRISTVFRTLYLVGLISWGFLVYFSFAVTNK
jgi:hypothetical protein